jgi:hypothetical protein
MTETDGGPVRIPKISVTPLSLCLCGKLFLSGLSRPPFETYSKGCNV